MEYPIIGQTETNGEVVRKATVSNDPDQGRIARVGLSWLATLLRKNRDYGASVWRQPILSPSLNVGEAIYVRMSDKVERIRSLRQQEPSVKDETLEDTIADLGSYCLLLLTRPPDGEEDNEHGVRVDQST